MSANPERMKYRCSSCKYSFTRKAGLDITACPYCGKKNTLEMHKNDYASKILDEVDKMPRLND